jgi:hypothetical protein
MLWCISDSNLVRRYLSSTSSESSTTRWLGKCLDLWCRRSWTELLFHQSGKRQRSRSYSIEIINRSYRCGSSQLWRRNCKWFICIQLPLTTILPFKPLLREVFFYFKIIQLIFSLKAFSIDDGLFIKKSGIDGGISKISRLLSVN